MKAVVIDDHATSVALLSALMVRAGWAVASTSVPEDAARLVDAERPDVVVLDLAMPGMDGLEVLRLLRSQRLCPIVVHSGFGHPNLKTAAMRLGATDYVQKGDVESLLGAMRRAASRPARPRTRREARWARMRGLV